jgi:sterol desaturase/sphingolipid hydroxylase (fatty acid hydroxylase superfamily)
MRLSKFSYYSELFVYPALIPALAVTGLANTGWVAASGWITLCLGFLVLWTLIEYLLHRFVFHHIPFIREMHQGHHVEERAYIGTPLWVSLSAHCSVALFPIWFVFGFWAASAAVCGLATGYIWYVAVHHILHHWHPRHSGYLYRLKRHHALHHHVDPSCNFGVTTGIWDWVFGTLKTQDPAPALRSYQMRANGVAKA